MIEIHRDRFVKLSCDELIVAILRKSRRYLMGESK